MTREDMALLIEAEDDLQDLDLVLEKLSGLGHANGAFVKLDNIYKVIVHNCHSAYKNLSDEEADKFLYGIIMNRDLTADERADLLLSGKLG